MTAQKEFGDFQTPVILAEKVIALVSSLFGARDLVVEPTAGLGSFLEAANMEWGSSARYEGYEINPAYVLKTSAQFAGKDILLKEQDFFSADWEAILGADPEAKLLVVGNPPWVTNSALGTLGSANLPDKTNFQGLRGFDAKTGKANFDIAEWMLIKLFESLPPHGAMAMLCKTMTARKVLLHFWKTIGGVADAKLFSIDAKTHFGVSVDACLFYASARPSKQQTAEVYLALSTKEALTEFGIKDGRLVSNIRSYVSHMDIDGGSSYIWRSGLKHDAAMVMELTPENGHYRNGYGETVVVENTHVYPLLKSSDVANGRIAPRHFVLVTQTKTGDATNLICDTAPKTWQYLESHAHILDARRSSIYRKRPRFCLFGIGDYSFALWKVAISGLYKTLRFVTIPPLQGQPVMLDDTCYFISCNSEQEARFFCELLNSSACQEFLESLVFLDSKRPVTTEALRRISLRAIASRLGRLDEFESIIAATCYSVKETGGQLGFVMEDKKEYKTRSRRGRSK